MKIVVNKLDALKRELQIEIPQEKVKNKFDEVYEEIKKTAKVPGFRPGTAPRNILEKHHSKFASEEVIRQLLPETYQEAIKTENLDAVSLPEITDVNLDSASLRYKATIEIRPEIEIKNYTKIKVKRSSNEVTDEEMQKALDKIKEQRKIDALNDDFAHGLGYANLEEFKNALKRQLIAQKESDNKIKLENEIIDYLLKNSKFSVPQSLVDKRIEELKDNLRQYLEKNRLPNDEIEKKEKEFEPKLKEQAMEQVKVFLVLDEIAKRENIQRDDHMPNHTIEFLLKNADWTE